MNKKRIALGALGVVAVPTVAYLAGLAFSMGSMVTGAAAATVKAVAPPPVTFELDRVAMIKSLEDKLEMTTFSMRLEKFVPGGTCGGNAWQQFAWSQCMTILVPAKVNAGFDWKTFGPSSIQADHQTVTVNLGSPKILDVVLDPAHAKVIGESYGLFSTYDSDLQLRVLDEARKGLYADACTNGILDGARLSAEKQVGDILRQLLTTAKDKRTVKIVFATPRC